jgi:hypothetical protein
MLVQNILKSGDFVILKFDQASQELNLTISTYFVSVYKYLKCIWVGKN